MRDGKGWIVDFWLWGGQGMSVLTSLFVGGKVPRDEHALWGRMSVQFHSDLNVTAISCPKVGNDVFQNEY